MTKQCRVLGFLTTAIVLGTGALHAQDTQQGTSEIVNRWLLNTCGVGDSEVQAQQLRGLGTRARAALIRAFTDGPAVSSVREVEVQAEERFTKRQALLERGTGLGLSPEHLAAARRVTRTEFVTRATSDFVHQYRAEALRGLAVIGGEEARAFLRAIADDEASEFGVVATLALEKF